MATSATRSRMLSSRARRAYRLEMEGRTLMLLVGLMALTGLVVFYLGVMTGRALRDPNLSVATATVQEATPTADEGAPSGSGLGFNEALTGGEGSLKTDGAQVTERTRELLSRAEQQLDLEEVTPKKPQPVTAPTVKQPSAPSAAAPKRPSQPQAGVLPAGEFTVQVFSSREQARAQELMRTLQSKGFPSYLNRFESTDKQVWYRVRVGKTTRDEAEVLSSRLKGEPEVRDPRILAY